jgi:short-subunit dehydrogenase
MTTISGKRVLLTGGSRGLGPVIAEALACRGAHIALVARSEEGLNNTAKSLSKYGIQTVIIPADLSQPDQQHGLISKVLDKFGSIDILINNAGLETEGAYLDLPWEAIQQTVDVNLIAPMALTYEVLPHMVKRKSGHIVNIASVGAKSGGAYAATYCGTKAGLAEWAKGLRQELEAERIYFSTVFPGYVTDVGMFARFHMTPPALIGSCTPSQVANAVVRAIEKNKLEVLVNSSPNALVAAISELSPGLGDWIVKRVGAVDFQRRKVRK